MDGLIVFAAMAVAVSIEWPTPAGGASRLWRGGALSNVATWKLLAAFAGFAVVLLWISSHHDQSTLSKRSLLEEQKLNLRDCAITGLFLASVLYLIGAESLPRGFVLLFVVLVAFGLGLRRLIYRAFPEDPSGPRNVLIIGTDSIALAVREQVRDDPELGYIFKGFVKLTNAEPDSIAYPEEIVGTTDKLSEHVCKYSVSEVFLTPSCGREMALRLADQARELGIGARLIPGYLRFGVDLKNGSHFEA